MNEKLKESIKKFMACIGDKIDAVYTQMQQTKLENACQMEHQEKQQFSTYAQFYLQEALFYVLSKATITTLLCQLRYPSDLLPVKMKIRSGDTTIYYYKWTKQDSSHMIPLKELTMFTPQMNAAIRSELQRLGLLFATWDWETQCYFINTYPALYNGFRVLGCKDAGNEIILAVEYL